MYTERENEGLQPTAHALADHLSLEHHRQQQLDSAVVKSHARNGVRAVPAPTVGHDVIPAAAVGGDPLLEPCAIHLCVAYHNIT